MRVDDNFGDAVDGHRVHTEDADGRAVLGQRVDDRVHAVLRGGRVLAAVTAGAAAAGAGVVMDGHRVEGIVRGLDPIVVRVGAGLVHRGQGQVAMPATTRVRSHTMRPMIGDQFAA